MNDHTFTDNGIINRMDSASCARADNEVVSAYNSAHTLLVDAGTAHSGQYSGVPAPGFIPHEHLIPSLPTPTYTEGVPRTDKISTVAGDRASKHQSHTGEFRSWLTDLSSECGVLIGAAYRGLTLNPPKGPSLAADEAATKSVLESCRLFPVNLHISCSKGVAGAIGGGLAGYVLGYVIGDIVEFCFDGIAKGISLIAGTVSSTDHLLSGINTLKDKFLETSTGTAEFDTMHAWDNQYNSTKERYENDLNYRNTIDRGYVIIGTAAGEAFLQRGSLVPSVSAQTPVYILNGTNYDLGSVALGYLLNARSSIIDDRTIFGINPTQLHPVYQRVNDDIHKVLDTRHNLPAIFKELSTSEYCRYQNDFDDLRLSIKENLQRKFRVSAQLQNKYKAKAWRDLALVDLAACSNGINQRKELQRALASAAVLDPNNEDLQQLQQLASGPAILHNSRIDNE